MDATDDAGGLGERTDAAPGIPGSWNAPSASAGPYPRPCAAP